MSERETLARCVHFAHGDFEHLRAGLPAPLIDLAQLGEQAASFARRARAPQTERCYRSDWEHFEKWCAAASLVALPADAQTVGLYSTDCAKINKLSTIKRRIATISVVHRLAGHRLDTRHPAISEVLSGINRVVGYRRAPKAALSVEELKHMLRRLPPGIAGDRDRALLLIGFAGAFRRSELSQLDIADVRISTRGVALLVRRSKTDQEGAGQVIGIPRSKKHTCPVAALERWIVSGGISAGALFRPVNRHGQVSELRLSGQAIARVVKDAAARLGLDAGKYAGHSLRRGFATSASAKGADLAQIMRQTRHRSVTVAMQYVDEGQLFSNPASRAIGL